MQTAWDYTALAAAYVKRPDYAESAIDAMLTRAGIKKGASACDVGAGVAHLTLMLIERGLNVTAVEPNDAMRAIGRKRVQQQFGKEIKWTEATGENTGQPDAAYDLVTFGSSFNVCDRQKALIETTRILKPKAWFACMWNHRDLEDPLQKSVEQLITSYVPEYGYGTRREDQTEEIAASKLFTPAETIEGRVVHTVPTTDWIEAWRSHATLERQAEKKFHEVVAAIEQHLLGQRDIDIPYTTRIWLAQKLK
jgi:SAM-dependent methyltransferase